MDWLQLIIEPGPPGPDIIEKALFEQGALSVTLLDAANQPIFEPLPGTTPLWPAVRIVALFPVNTCLEKIMPGLESGIGTTIPAYRTEILAKQDWRTAWMQDFKPMRFGERLWVCPGGQEPEDSDAIIVELDPGLAFGTGAHPTTSLCLQWLERCGLEDLKVLDYGCGSGILAIAALKLGAASATAVDIDPQALISTKDNARRNNVASALTVCRPENTPDLHFDRVVANILAEPLIELAPELARFMPPGALIGVSGILQEQIKAVEQRYQTWFDMQPSVIMGDWVLLRGTRNRE